MIRSYDFVEILNDHEEEAMYYYELNWLPARELAVEKGYIESFDLLETRFSKDCPFHVILITTYSDSAQYKAREKNFDKVFEIRGERKLLNELQPSEFRGFVFDVHSTRHRRSSE